MPPHEWIPMALLAQVTGYYHRHSTWPTIQDLAVYTQLPLEKVKELLKVLVDRRFVKVDGETVYPWEAGPSPVVTYRLSPEEIAARYGPPTRPARKPQVTEEADDMPKGIHITWPPAAELVAMANEIHERGGNVLGELAERFGCSTFTVRKQLRLARLAILQAASKKVGSAVEATAQGEPGPVNAPTTAQADEEAGETMAHVDWPDAQTLVKMADDLAAEGRSAAGVIAARLGVHPGTVRKKLQEARRLVVAMTKGGQASPDAPDPGETPSPDELMQEAEEEATRLVGASVGQPDPSSVDPGISDHPREETAVSEAYTTPAPEELATFRTMLLVDPGALTTRWERDHVTRAPEKEGDHWAQPVRERGFLRWREWVCVAVVADGTCLMVPPEAAATTEQTEQRRTA